MAVVAGLFDSQAAASAAMDDLMTHHFHNMDTRVVGGKNDNTLDTPGVVLPVVPNTGSSGQPGGVAPAGALFGRSNIEWMDKLDEEERGFYYEGLKEGATLAVVKVDDEDADQVRRMLNLHGARAYAKK